jgi:hypothetical protein
MNQEEFRCILTNQEALKILNQAKIIRSFHVVDEYTGTKRIRVANFTEIIEKDYPTEVTGKTARIGYQIELPNIKGPTYLEHKITDKQFARWEIEFECDVPEQYKNRENIHGWTILIDQDK